MSAEIPEPSDLAADVDIVWSSIFVLTSGALAVDSVADNHRNVARDII